MKTGDSTQRSMRWVLLPMLGYAAVLVLSLSFLRIHADSMWRIPIALAPVIPVAIVVWGGVRATRKMDELQQRIALEGSTFANRTMIVLSIGYGFLQNAGFPAINWILMGAAMIALSAVGSWLSRWNYR